MARGLLSPHDSEIRLLRHALACALAQYRRESRGHPRPRVTCATFPSLLTFAREFARADRRASIQNPKPKIQNTYWPCPGDFPSELTAIAAKWFNRGLSGRVLWLIAEQLLGRGTR